jgi:hypothetical protein
MLGHSIFYYGVNKQNTLDLRFMEILQKKLNAQHSFIIWDVCFL